MKALRKIAKKFITLSDLTIWSVQNNNLNLGFFISIKYYTDLFLFTFCTY